MKYTILEKLTALREKLSVRKAGTRLLALLLALVLLQGDFMLSAYSAGEDSGETTEQSTVTENTTVPTAPEQAEAEPEVELPVDEDTLVITLDGAETTAVSLLPYEKTELKAEGLESDAEYQWQIRHPETGAWINIYDATEQCISVSTALVKNMLNKDGTAALRCYAHAEKADYVTSFVTVTTVEESVAPVTLASSSAFTTSGDTITLAVDDPLPEFVTITIQYWLYDYELQSDGQTFVEVEEGQAFTSYVATVKSTGPGEDPTPLSAVHCPTIVGYTPQLTKITKGGENLPILDSDFQTIVTDGVSSHYVHFRNEAHTADIVYRVEYHPAEVQYKIRYFFQNVYDDLYVEDANLVKNTLGKTTYPLVASGYTGKHPDKTYTEAKFTGFTSLYYEPEFIAADGSTIFEIYYERNYYLMEFDCAEGYGTDTVYVRYGTYISVPNPVRAGWVFKGWDLVKTEDPNSDDALGDPIYDTEGNPTGFYKGDGTANNLPSTMPAYNSAYKALWTQADTTYTTAYWIRGDDDKDTFLGSRTQSAKSGSTVVGKEDPNLDKEVICGLSEHAHTDSCYGCGQVGHAHSINCYSSSIVLQGEVTQAGHANDWNAMVAANNGSEPENGYLYFIQANNDAYNGIYWPKMYIGDKYYTITVNGQSSINASVLSSITEGAEIYRATVNGFTAIKYKAKTNNCSLSEHIHNNTCQLSCNLTAHTHSDSCKPNLRYLQYLGADGVADSVGTETPVLVEGDGSTVVNVYYQYKEYTLKFYYAASTTSGTGDSITTNYYVVGGSTYYFGRQNGTNTDDDFIQLKKMFNQTSQIGRTATGAVPSLNQTGQDRVTHGIYTQGSDYDSDTARTYYYISFKARYGDNISEKWPIDVFNSVEMASGQYNETWGKPYATVSAWNGEHHVKYSQTHDNETIKGKYEKLDDQLLFHSDYTDASTVSYLCFWENGAPLTSYNRWNIPNLFRYNIWLEAASSEITTDTNGNPVHVNGVTRVKERNGVIYKRIDAYDTCDDSNLDGQTQPALTGYIANGRSSEELTDVAEVTDPETQFDSDLYASGMNVHFYYLTNEHQLIFWNHNRYLMDGTGVTLHYGTPLKLYAEGTSTEDGANDLVVNPANYPEGLEPGAYEFAGWYTTSNCLNGTQVNWETITMPDNDLKLYAYWKPVIRNVYFYYDYSEYAAALSESDPTKKEQYYWFHTDVNGNKVPKDGYPIKVEHGSLVGTTYSNQPEAQPGYTYVGWFYMDENNKKRFAPDSMEVKRDLHLFAEWQSGIDTTYTVTYVLDEPYLTFSANEPIASATTGHLTAGKTKTFAAKVDTELFPNFHGKPLFPVINSHSILMDSNPNNNTYEFRYKSDEKVFYIVRYINKITGVEMCDSVIRESTNAIVTEKFLPFTGFIPDNYYIRKVLAFDGTANNTYTADTVPMDQIRDLNEIIFYYTPDTEHGIYVIEYYTPVLGATNDQLYNGNEPKMFLDVDKTVPNPYWKLEQSTIGTEDLVDSNGNPYTLSVPLEKDKFTGFSYDRSTITTYSKTGTPSVNVNDDADATHISGTISQNGLELRIYYKRNSYDYIVEFLEIGTNQLLGYGKANYDGQVFDTPDNTQHQYKSHITYTAPAQIEKIVNGVKNKYLFLTTAEKPQTQSLTIDASNTETVGDVTTRTSNVLTFYYKAREVVFEYKAVCPTAPGATNFGKVSLESETVSNTTNISGATAIPGVGFNFVGWYSDEACTDANQISTDLQFAPKSIPNDVDKVTYYARFEPVLASMKVTKVVEGVTSDDTFLFLIEGQGKHTYLKMTVAVPAGSTVTIAEIPIDEYKVTELTTWSWKYSKPITINAGAVKEDSTTVDLPNAAITFTIVEQDTHQTKNNIQFTNQYVKPDWLGGESAIVDKNFN